MRKKPDKNQPPDLVRILQRTWDSALPRFYPPAGQNRTTGFLSRLSLQAFSPHNKVARVPAVYGLMSFNWE